RRDDLRLLQVRRLRADRAFNGTRVRRAVPSPHGSSGRTEEHRLGRRQPFVRASLLPPAPFHRGGSVRICVTGGARFIGSHVVDKLLDAGHDPRIFDIAASQHHSPSDVETVTAELCDPAALKMAFRGCDAIIHLAAESDPRLIAENPVETDRTNTT